MLLTLVAWAASAQTPPAPAPAPPAAPAAGGPAVAPCTVLVPYYTIDGKNPPQAGLMFSTKVGEKQLLVTAYSMFGPAGGLSAQIPAAEMKTRVTGVVAKDALATATACARSVKALPVADAAVAGGDVDATKDLAVFEVAVASGYDALQAVAPVPLAPLVFAPKQPKVGEKVYLLAPMKGRQGSAWSAKVVQSDTSYLFFQYDDATIDLVGTAGAPVVDATGALIGVNLPLGGKMQDGALIGGATPLVATKQRVEAAAK